MAYVWRPTPSTRRPRADDPDYDEEEATKKREAKDLALKKERDALWKRNDLGETALHVAALRGHERVCKWLLERPSCDSVDPQDWTTGATPLWNACQAGKLKAAKVLLAKGADPEAAPVLSNLVGRLVEAHALASKACAVANENVKGAVELGGGVCASLLVERDDGAAHRALQRRVLAAAARYCDAALSSDDDATRVALATPVAATAVCSWRFFSLLKVPPDAVFLMVFLTPPSAAAAFFFFFFGFSSLGGSSLVGFSFFFTGRCFPCP